jgi:hypothetical protein
MQNLIKEGALSRVICILWKQLLLFKIWEFIKTISKMNLILKHRIRKLILQFLTMKEKTCRAYWMIHKYNQMIKSNYLLICQRHKLILMLINSNLAQWPAFWSNNKMIRIMNNELILIIKIVYFYNIYWQ